VVGRHGSFAKQRNGSDQGLSRGHLCRLIWLSN